MLPCQQNETFALIRQSLDRIERRFDTQDDKLESMDSKISDLAAYKGRIIGFSAGATFVISAIWAAYTGWK